MNKNQKSKADNALSQILLTMKITLLLLFFCAMQMYSNVMHGQSVNLTINKTNITLEEFIDQVESQSEYRFLYNKQLINLNGKLSIKVESKEIESVLNDVFTETDISYKIHNKQVVLSPKITIEKTVYDKKKIKGVIHDEEGEVAVGATVVVKNNPQQGTITDIDGNFSLDVSPDDILIISMLGHNSIEVQVKGKEILNLVLKADTKLLDEVVVVGYGVQKKVNLTGSIASINGDEIKDIPAANLSNVLSGRLAGVLVTQRAGKPGGSSDISVRAQGTWNNSAPLYVIDGVVRDQFAFDGLDMSEVENLSVLKDGASAAVYGARAANGVILVTTKKGKMGKPIITYSGSIGISDATKIPKTQNAYNQAMLINDNLTVEKIDPSDMRFYSPDELEYFKHNNANWLDESWKEPIITRHSVNVSGGNEAVRYFIGGSFFSETGSFDNLSFKKYNVRSNLEANITKNLIATLNINMDVRNDAKPFWRWDSDNDQMRDLYKGLLFRSGQLQPYVNGLANGTFVEWHPMEIISNKHGYNRKKHSNYEVNIGLQYDLPWVKGLSVKAQYNNYMRHRFTKYFNRPYDLFIFKTEGEHKHIVTNEMESVKSRNDGDYLQQRYNSGNNYQLNAYVTYANSFGKHDVGGLFVYEQSEEDTHWFDARGNYFLSAAIDQLFAASSDAKDSTIDGKAEETGRMSYVGRLNYGYDQKYIAEVSFRYDGSSVFAPKNRWGFFPSLSFAWRISEESFYKQHIEFMNYFKLKASIGLLGNDAVAGWQWMQRYKLLEGAQFGKLSSGVEPGVLANENITWEKSLTTDIGFDAAFFRNKLTLNASAFYRNTYDILGSRLASLPTTFGANMPSENYAEIDAKGFEIEIGYNDAVGKDIKYYLKGNMGYAVNELKVKDEAENLRPYKSEIGYSTDRQMGHIATGIIRTQEELNALPAGYTIFGQKPEIGMLNYKDLRGANSDSPDGMIDDLDQDWIINHTRPPVNYGFSIGGSWKNLSLDVFFQGVAGNKRMIDMRYAQARPQETNFDFWTDHWTPENPNAAFPRASRSTSDAASTFWIRDASFLRLKNISLSYALPKSILSKMNVAHAKVFVSGSNLFLLQNKLKYYDPENSSIVAYPLMKNYSLGINFSF